MNPIRTAFAVLATALVLDVVGAYKQLHLCNGSGRRYCANSQRAVRCPDTCRPENCVPRPMGAAGAFYTRCYQIRPPVCETIYWEDVAATNVYDYVYLNTTMDQSQAQVCMSTCREEPFRGICLATEKGVNGVDYCKQVDCRRLKMPNQSGCHQPRDFHAPTCMECERLFPMACGGDGGGVLKGWKALRAELDRKEQLEADRLYNVSVSGYAEVMDSSFDDVYRWLNGAAAPRIPSWYQCAKMNSDRLAFLKELVEQDKLQKEREAWQSQRVSTLPENMIEALMNGTYSGFDFPEAFGAVNEEAFTPDDEESSASAGDLTSSEALPYAVVWEELKCDKFFEDAFKAVDSADSDSDDDDDDDSSELDDLLVDGTLDWLPPWHWQPWQHNWKPLPKGMQWYWEVMEAMELQIQSEDPDATHASVVAGLDTLVASSDSGNVAGILESSTVMSISDLSGVSIQAAGATVQPKVVNIIFQLEDTAQKPFIMDENALKSALASIPSVPAGNVSIMDVFQDVTQQLVTISASIQAEFPVEASAEYAKAERSGEVAVALEDAGFVYLEVSMTSTVAYAPEGLYTELIEAISDDRTRIETLAIVSNTEAGKGMTIAIAAGCAAAALAVAAAIIAVVIIIRKRKSAAAETSKAAEKPVDSTETTEASKGMTAVSDTPVSQTDAQLADVANGAESE